MPRGEDRIKGMRGRRKGGLMRRDEDGFDRSSALTLASQMDAWCEYLSQRNYAKSTIDGYRCNLKSFVRWAEERSLSEPSEVTRPMLESYQKMIYNYRKVDGQPLKVRTQLGLLHVVQAFFRHLCKTNVLGANPASDLDLPRKQPKLLPRGLSQEEIRQLMSIPDVTDALGLRDRAIIELLYATGMRRKELVELDVPDIDFAGATVFIRKGKGGRSRILPLSAQAQHWLESYLETSRPRLLVRFTEQALFLSGYGDRFNQAYITNWLTRTMKKAGIDKLGSCHLLRHSCATHMLDNGADIRYIQQILGHRDLCTTQVYTEVSIESLRTIYTQTHPSAQEPSPKTS